MSNKKERKSIGFKILMGLLRKTKKESKFIYLGEKIDTPSVILSNHVSTSGPLSFELFSGINFRFWGAYQMNSGLRAMYKYQTRVFYHEKRGWNIHLARIYCLLASPLTNIIYGGLNLISTYPDARFVKTIKESHEAINDGKSIVIFPEISDKGYLDELEGFHKGFLTLLKYMARKGTDMPVVVTYYNKYNGIHVVDKKVMYSELVKKYGTEDAIAKALCERCNKLGKMSQTQIFSEQNTEAATQSKNKAAIG